MKRIQKTVFKGVLCVSLIVVVLIFSGQVFAQEGKPVNLSMATFKSGSGWYIMGQGVATVIEKALPKGSNVDVLPYSGGVGNPLLLHQGKAEIAFAFPIETGLAMRGEPPYKEAIKELRLLTGGFDNYWYIFSVREKIALKSLEEIKEKKYPLDLVTLPKGSSGEWITGTILKSHGITYDDLKSWGGKVTHTSFPTAVETIKDGYADAFAHVCTPGHPSWTQLTTMVKLKFLPTRVDTLIKKYNFKPAFLPKGSFRGVSKDVPVLGFATCIIATEKMTEDVAYKITKAICTNKEALVAVYKAAEAFDPEKAWDAPIPLHPGAMKFYKEAGYMK